MAYAVIQMGAAGVEVCAHQDVHKEVVRQDQEGACLLAVDHHFMAEASGIAQTSRDSRSHALKGEGDHGATPPKDITPCNTPHGERYYCVC